MKKKLIVLILAVVLILSTVLTGCTFFKLNKERQANEVLATVSKEYGGQKIELTVTRNELISYVNYVINLYSQYGMSYDGKALLEQGLDSLINQKYMVIQGMIYLMELDNRKDVMFAKTPEYQNVYGDKITPEGVLTIGERYSSIANTNESFISDIKSYVENYDTEIREREVSAARERLTAQYADGYSVKEDGVTVYYKNADGQFVAGLYQDSFIYDKDKTVEPDYKKVYLKIDMVKSGADDVSVYLPVSEASVTTAADEDADFISQYVTAKICLVTYDEPTKDEDGNENYKTHTGKAGFTLVTPRTAYTEPTKEDTRDAATVLKEGSVKYRYEKFTGDLSDELKEIVEKGQIFEHTKEKYDSDGEKDAYRQFREKKKGLLINFDADNDDAYNSLGYYYLSGFESAVLSAVQHELKRAALTAAPITDEQIQNQYKILIEKQKEEYSVLDKKAQVDKFAETVKSDLTSAYYVPIEALLSEELKFDYGEYKNLTYATESDGKYTINMFYIAHILFKWTDKLNTQIGRDTVDRDDEEIKAIKAAYVNYLKTNKSVLDYATADEKGDKLEDAFEVEEGKIKEFDVKTVIGELENELKESDEPFEVFKKYMTYFNDDSGSMSSDLGYVVTMGDIAHSYDGDDFPNMAKDLYLSLIKDGANPNNAKEISEYAFTSYGLHIEYISFAPFYNITLTAEGGLGADFKLDLKGSTFRDSIKKSLEESVNSAKYSEWTSQYTSEEATASAVKNEKKFKNLLKDLGIK